MRELIVIKGKAGSGKTTRVKEITRGKNCVYINYVQDSYWLFSMVNKNTEYIVFDNVTKKGLKKIKKVFKKEYMRIESPCVPIKIISTPNFIVEMVAEK